MTLIIAKICHGAVRVESDSTISDPNIVSNRNSIFSGVLKSIILNPSIAVSFAGDVEVAQSAIDKLFKENIFDITNVKKVLLSFNIESRHTTDFLITSLESQPLLYKVQNGKIEVTNQSFWIGDIDGFNEFQREFVPNLKSLEPNKILETQTKAFDKVIEKGIPGIGGFRITFHRTEYGLQYLLQLSTYSGRPVTIKTSQNQSGNVILPIPFGDASTGAYSQNYLISKDPFKSAIGIHFHYGNFGALFCPRVSRKIIVVSNVNDREFIDTVKKSHNVELTGMIFKG
nr:hypothetical protein [uncultured Flavobacterium sp.]